MSSAETLTVVKDTNAMVMRQLQEALNCGTAPGNMQDALPRDARMRV